MRRLTPVMRRAAALALSLLASSGVVRAQQQTAQSSRVSPLAPILDSLRAIDAVSSTLPVPPGVDPRYSARLDAIRMDDFAVEQAALERIQAQFAALDRATFDHGDSLDAEILALRLRDRIAELRFRGYLLPLGSRSGFHFGFAGAPEDSRFATVADYDRYIARLQSFLEHTRQQIAVLREGMRSGITMPRAVLDGYDRTASMHVVVDPAASPFARPLERVPASIAAEERARIHRDGMEAIRASVLPGFAEFARFLAEEYIPASRRTLGVTELPNGRAYYEHRVRMFTTMDITPEAVHAIGLENVTRIRKEMDAIRAEVGFAGDHAAFVEHLRNDPRFTVATETEYLALVSHASKLMDGNLPQLFSKLPITPYGVRPMPSHVAPRQSAGYYDRGAADGSRAGWVNINTSMLRSRPTWAARALAFHEGVPGHHLQIMLALERADISPLRRGAGVTVFIEGWGLYAEKLGLDVGLYDDPYDRFGMWSYQIWRACRLVVDTGMHALGWTRERAIAYMAENTGMTVEAVTAEIDRHITEPGQGLAYTMGELEITALRRAAEERLGGRFDVREFHEAVLQNGALPLPVLRREVMGWIERTAAGR
jgi:uncharacterized protein (DUF885 family)